jgi:hypothetical protein
MIELRRQTDSVKASPLLLLSRDEAPTATFSSLNKVLTIKADTHDLNAWYNAKSYHFVQAETVETREVWTASVVNTAFQ